MTLDSPIDWSNIVPKKVSVRVNGHFTSVSLEQPFLDILKAVAQKKGQSLALMITDIDNKKPQTISLSASLRLYALHSILTQQF
ncbi:ribbon-helix-helix domain-containing protein [Bartonella ancashensis]|uniref:Ribbon-helix-helix domain-containing protein n=1 Tax=Bartonella ancashensis TaxID=1318743 RepID=A0A0M5L151_9HYPH|nr:ribbon-helix-helix domain-containing protein [Bartonella ancashensis]ALE03636.1 hypothetical protein PU02_0822 [Bartonella ancashensis]